MKSMESRYSLLSQKYFTETVIPKIHEGIGAEGRKEIANFDWFSFTTDIWSTEVSIDLLLSWQY